MFRRFLYPILFLEVFHRAAFALPVPSETVSLSEIVVEGKRLRGDHRSAVVLSSKELARESGRPIGEVLRESAGVDFITGTGGNSNILIRGASGSQALVLIDGVKANDPSATNRYFDWSRVDTTQIERIEILKGPQAVSYGSDAVGGVILIWTKRGIESVTASMEVGSEAFARARTTLGIPLGEKNTLRLQAFGKGIYDGRSSALSASGAPTEGDDLEEASIGAQLATDYNDWLRSRISADLRSAREEIDGGAFLDDPNLVARNREIRSSARFDGRSKTGNTTSLLLSHLDFRRDYSSSLFRGQNTRGEAQFHSSPDDAFERVLGLEGTREKLEMESSSLPVRLGRDHADAIAFFGEGRLPLLRGENRSLLSGDFGSRFSHFTSFGNQWSGKAGLTSIPSSEIEVDVGISTGFKAPSLFSLYDPVYGNTSLKPEEAVQAEMGIAYAPATDMRLSVRGFGSRVRNRFGFDPVSFRSLNTERAEVLGIEVENETRLSGAFRVRPTMTYLSSKDRHTGRELTDLPRWKGSMKLEWEPSESSSIILSFLTKSSRGASAGLARVAGFSRIDFTARGTFTENWTGMARVENAFDRDYQEIRGYSTPGASAFLGVEYRN